MKHGHKYQKTTLSNYQSSHNLYGGPNGGMDNYFVQIKAYFGQSKYDQLIQGFMRASSLYMDTIKLAEWHLYGSSRIGIYQANLTLASRSVRIESGTETQVNSTTIAQQSYTYFTGERGCKRFELTNHLGNVLAVVTDKKVAICSTGVFAFWKAELVSATDYAPFGAPLAGRSYSSESYRYGFNGKENDNEVKGDGGQQDYGMRVYDTRLGKFLSVDPLTAQFPWWTPFQFSGNMPIKFIDLDGMEPMSPDIPNSRQAIRKMNKYDRKLEKFARETGGSINNQATIDAFNTANANRKWMYISEPKKILEIEQSLSQILRLALRQFGIALLNAQALEEILPIR